MERITLILVLLAALIGKHQVRCQCTNDCSQQAKDSISVCSSMDVASELRKLTTLQDKQRTELKEMETRLQNEMRSMFTKHSREVIESLSESSGARVRQQDVDDELSTNMTSDRLLAVNRM